MRGFLPIATALGIGVILEGIVTVASGSTGYVRSNLSDEWGPLFFNVLIASAPFLLLASRGVTARTPWIIGLVLAVLVWGYVGLKFLMGGFKGGTSVGNSMWLGMVLITSSAAITITCWIVSRRYPRDS